MNRRNLIKSLAGIPAVALVPGLALGATPKPKFVPDPISFSTSHWCIAAERYCLKQPDLFKKNLLPLHRNRGDCIYLINCTGVTKKEKQIIVDTMECLPGQCFKLLKNGELSHLYVIDEVNLEKAADYYDKTGRIVFGGKEHKILKTFNYEV